MKRIGVLIMVALSVMAAGCADSDGIEPALDEPGMPLVEQQRVHNAWRVDMIVGTSSYFNIFAEYDYNDAGRLVKANLAEQNIWDNVSTRLEERFEWDSDLIVKQLTHRQYTGNGYREDSEQDFEMIYKYDAEGRLLHHGADDNWPGDRQYEYDAEGRLVQTYSYEFGGMIYRDRLEWDDRGNVVKYTVSMPESGDLIGTPKPGTYREAIFEYEYDNHPKPNFGLGEAFFWDGRYNPWPGAGNANEQLARTLSRNNLTRCEQGRVAYRYTYNEEGLPETVQTVWIGIGTAEPVQTIHYKQVLE